MFKMFDALDVAAFLRATLKIYRSWAAEGRCTIYSLLLSVLLAERGIEHEIIVWMLDREQAPPGETFADHWAVAVDYPYVIDITYPQVAPGDLRLAVDARYDYPAHYRGPLRYPAGPLLAAGGAAIGRGELKGSVAYRVFIDRMVPIMSCYDGGAYHRHLLSVSHAADALERP